MERENDKYPRTPHVPSSPGATKDDRKLSSLACFMGRPVVITEKLDGSNVCLTRDDVFARSHSGPPTHASFDLLKVKHACVRSLIPEGIQLFGEWLYAVHSIKYDKLGDHLYVFGIRDTSDAKCWRWWHHDDVLLFCDKNGFKPAPVDNYVTACTEDRLRLKIEAAANDPSHVGSTREGVVVRVQAAFSDHRFHESVAKWVRPNHVTTDQHWKSKPIERNTLA